MLAGGLLVCVLMALFMANAGGAWDNAKKYIEKGNLGGKGTDTHSAAVVGDTVGDPWECIVCGLIYDEEEGWPDDGIEPGTNSRNFPLLLAK